MSQSYTPPAGNPNAGRTFAIPADTDFADLVALFKTYSDTLPFTQTTQFRDPVANAAALPDGASGINVNGDIRVTLDDGNLHIWQDSPAPGNWNNIGPASAPTPLTSTQTPLPGAFPPAIGTLGEAARADHQHPSEVPAYSVADANRILGVSPVDGSLEWVDAPAGLPGFDAFNAGMIPMVDATGQFVDWVDAPIGLPDPQSGLPMQVVALNAAGTGFEYVDLDHVPPFATTNPVGPGAASVGAQRTTARGDHRHPRETPLPAATDIGKVLEVNPQGVAAWVTRQPLPAQTLALAGQALFVNAAGNDVEWRAVLRVTSTVVPSAPGTVRIGASAEAARADHRHAAELPATSATLSNRILAVNAAGTGVEWVVPGGGAASFKPAVANTANLPATGNVNGDVRVTLNDGHMHVWIEDATTPANSRWDNIGPAAANPIPTYGATDAGKVLAVNVLGSGLEWSAEDIHWLPPVTDTTALANVTGMHPGDAVIVRLTHEMYVYTGAVWERQRRLPTIAPPTGVPAASPDQHKVLTVDIQGDPVWMNPAQQLIVSDTPPAYVDHALWFESDTGHMFVGFSNAWVQSAGGGSALFVESGTPNPPAVKDKAMWFDTDTGALHVGVQGVWVETGRGA